MSSEVVTRMGLCQTRSRQVHGLGRTRSSSSAMWRWEAASEAAQRIARSSRSSAARSASARAISISISTSSCTGETPIFAGHVTSVSEDLSGMAVVRCFQAAPARHTISQSPYGLPMPSAWTLLEVVTCCPPHVPRGMRSNVYAAVGSVQMHIKGCFVASQAMACIRIVMSIEDSWQGLHCISQLQDRVL